MVKCGRQSCIASGCSLSPHSCHRRYRSTCAKVSFTPSILAWYLHFKVLIIHPCNWKLQAPWNFCSGFIKRFIKLRQLPNLAIGGALEIKSKVPQSYHLLKTKLHFTKFPPGNKSGRSEYQNKTSQSIILKCWTYISLNTKCFFYPILLVVSSNSSLYFVCRDLSHCPMGLVPLSVGTCLTFSWDLSHCLPGLVPSYVGTCLEKW